MGSRFDRRILTALGDSSKASSVYFPQLQGRTVAINMPHFMGWLSKALRSLVPDSSMDKFAICKAKHTSNANAGDECPFVKSMGLGEALPPFLGGTGPTPMELLDSASLGEDAKQSRPRVGILKLPRTQMRSRRGSCNSSRGCRASSSSDCDGEDERGSVPLSGSTGSASGDSSDSPRDWEAWPNANHSLDDESDPAESSESSERSSRVLSPHASEPVSSRAHRVRAASRSNNDAGMELELSDVARGAPSEQAPQGGLRSRVRSASYTVGDEPSTDPATASRWATNAADRSDTPEDRAALSGESAFEESANEESANEESDEESEGSEDSDDSDEDNDELDQEAAQRKSRIKLGCHCESTTNLMPNAEYKLLALDNRAKATVRVKVREPGAHVILEAIIKRHSVKLSVLEVPSEINARGHAGSAGNDAATAAAPAPAPAPAPTRKRRSHSLGVLRLAQGAAANFASVASRRRARTIQASQGDGSNGNGDGVGEARPCQGRPGVVLPKHQVTVRKVPFLSPRTLTGRSNTADAEGARQLGAARLKAKYGLLRGEWVLNDPCTFELRFDNTFSKLRSKKVLYRILVVNPPPATPVAVAAAADKRAESRARRAVPLLAQSTRRATKALSSLSGSARATSGVFRAVPMPATLAAIIFLLVVHYFAFLSRPVAPL